MTGARGCAAAEGFEPSTASTLVDRESGAFDRRGGNRQLNAALYRTVIVRMRHHAPTRDYVARRTTEGKSKKEIIRCLKRYLIREIYQLLIPVTQDTVTAR